MRKQKTPKPKLIHEFNKNSWEIIRVQFTEFKEQKLLDVRVWVLKDSGEYIPTRKGLSIKLEQVDSLKEAIDRATEEIEKSNEGKIGRIGHHKKKGKARFKLHKLHTIKKRGEAEIIQILH